MQNMSIWFKNHYKDLLIIILLIIILILGYIFYMDDEDKDLSNTLAVEEPIINDKTSNNNEDEEVKKTLKVDVKGAVKKPGVYELEENAIINDVITLAGGFNSNAYKNGINLSKKVSDEMVIYVYTKSEVNPESNEKKETITTCEVPTYNITECVKDKESIIENGTGNNSENNTNGTNNSLVNINTASVDVLTTLSGIGTSKAQAIVNYRNEHGNFKSIEEITNVSGIGETVFAKIKDYITV